jgi:hypothetical protein
MNNLLGWGWVVFESLLIVYLLLWQALKDVNMTW